MEFFISLRSRFKAIAFSSDDDWVEDDDDEDDDAMWCNLCDDDALATRDVVVLDLVDDELLLNTCIDLNTNWPKIKESKSDLTSIKLYISLSIYVSGAKKKDFKIVLFLIVFI